mgnify:CR=1 FL=1
MVKNVEGQLAKDPTNNDLRELHQNMQKMLHQSTFEDPRTPPKERALGAARAVAPSPAEAAHEWAEQEKIRASFEQAPEPEDEESPAPTASARKEEKQTRSELIHAALAHRRVVELIGASLSPPGCCIVMERCRFSLFERLHAQSQDLDRREMVNMAAQVASGRVG